MNTSVYCAGDHSCTNSYISGAATIVAEGAYSVKNAIIDTTDVDDESIVQISLYGYHAGYNTSVLCRSGKICYINCYGNGCYNTFCNKYNDYGGTCLFICVNAGPNNDCPQTSHTILPDDNLAFYMSEINSINEERCNLENSMTYDDYIYRGSDTISVLNNSNDGGNICCRGLQSCDSDETPVSTITVGGINGSIICGGYFSCYSVDNLIVSGDKGGIYCGGWYACAKTDITADHDTGVVVCGGEASCWEATIRDASKVFCTAMGCIETKVYGASEVCVNIPTLF